MCRPQRISEITSGPSLPSVFTPWFLGGPSFPWVPTLVPLFVLGAIWFLKICCPLKSQSWRIPHLPEMIYQSITLPHVSCIKYLLGEWTHPQQQRMGDNIFILTLHYCILTLCSNPSSSISFTPFLYHYLFISPHNHKNFAQSSSLPHAVVAWLQRWLPTILFILVKKHTASPISCGSLTALLLILSLAVWFALTNRMQVMFCEF